MMMKMYFIIIQKIFFLIFFFGTVQDTFCLPGLIEVLGDNVNISHPFCGYDSSINNRIVSGIFAKPNEYPFFVVFVNKGRPFGGATIINERWLVTAAHVVSSKMWMNSASQIKAGVGSNSLKNMKYVNIELSIPHPGYKINRKFDIALVKLAKPLRFSNKIYPICFPTKIFQRTPSKKINVIGFGFEDFHSHSASSILKSVILDVIPLNECRRIYSKINNQISADHTCTWTEGKDACLGDSGGPMFIKQNGRFVQWGVVSYGVTCADEFPGVFVTVTFFLNWIRRIIKNN